MLTTATKNTILKKFEEAKSSMLTKVFICGTISVVLITLIARKVYQRRKHDFEARKLKETLEKSRQQRRAIARTSNDQLSDDQRCVVCATNPKEVIIYPFSILLTNFDSLNRLFACHVVMFACARIVQLKFHEIVQCVELQSRQRRPLLFRNEFLWFYSITRC